MLCQKLNFFYGSHYQELKLFDATKIPNSQTVAPLPFLEPLKRGLRSSSGSETIQRFFLIFLNVFYLKKELHRCAKNIWHEI